MGGAIALSVCFAALILSADGWLPPGQLAEVLLFLAWGAALGLLGILARPGARVRAGALAGLMIVGIWLNGRWIEQQRGGVAAAPLIAHERHDLLSLAAGANHRLVIERALYLTLERFIGGKPVMYVSNPEIRPHPPRAFSGAERIAQIRPHHLLALSGAERIVEIPAPRWLPPAHVLADRYPTESWAFIREKSAHYPHLEYLFLGILDPDGAPRSFVVMNHQGVFLALPETVLAAERSRVESTGPPEGGP